MWQEGFHFWGTGIPRLVRFFGPQATALFEKPHYSGTDLVLKLQFWTFFILMV